MHAQIQLSAAVLELFQSVGSAAGLLVLDWMQLVYRGCNRTRQAFQGQYPLYPGGSVPRPWIELPTIPNLLDISLEIPV